MTEICKKCGKKIENSERMYTIETIESTKDYIVERGSIFLCEACYQEAQGILLSRKTYKDDDDGSNDAGFSVMFED